MPEIGTAHVWCLPVFDESPDEASFLDWLSDAERVRHNRFLFAKDRRLFLLGRVLVRGLLSGYFGGRPRDWQIELDDRGRPYLSNRPDHTALIFFNLSHTAGMVAAAFARTELVGVDVEREDRQDISLDVARRFFGPEELAELELLAPGPRQQRFFELWTLKEAYLKARGKGLAGGLDRVWFQSQAGVTVAHFDPELNEKDGDWHFQQWRDFAPIVLAAALHRGTSTRSKEAFSLRIARLEDFARPFP